MNLVFLERWDLAIGIGLLLSEVKEEWFHLKDLDPTSSCDGEYFIISQILVAVAENNEVQTTVKWDMAIIIKCF